MLEFFFLPTEASALTYLVRKNITKTFVKHLVYFTPKKALSVSNNDEVVFQAELFRNLSLISGMLEIQTFMSQALGLKKEGCTGSADAISFYSPPNGFCFL